MAANPDQIESPEQLLSETAKLQQEPITASAELNVPEVETLRDEVAEMARIASEGIVAGVDPEKWTDEQGAQAEEVVARLKQRTSDAEKTRKAITDPLEQSKRRIISFFKALTKYHHQAYDRTVTDLQRWRNERKRKEREQQRLAEEKAERERRRLAAQAEEAEEKGRDARADNLRDRAASVQASPGAQVTTSKGQAAGAVGYREEWKFEITDPAAIPREYMTPDEKKIGGVVKALKGDADIPGVRVYSVDVPVKKRS